MASAFVFYAYLIRQFAAGKRHTACRFNYKNNISFTDLIEKALRKLGEQALRNEIDVTDVWMCSLIVSPPKVRLYSHVVTYFILACSTNF